MAQAGIHALIGQAIRKWVPKAEWLMLGIVFGNLFPDTDNILVAVATLIKQPTEGLHRTFTHSLFFAAAVLLIFLAIGSFSRQKRWTSLGIGLAIGLAMHALIDLLIWFNGVSLFWPLESWINLWANVSPPQWFDTLMNPLEFLFLALFFYLLLVLAKKQKTDAGYLQILKIWLIIQLVLLVLFLPLLYSTIKLAYTVYGLFYLISLIAALVITVKMRKTIEYR